MLLPRVKAGSCLGSCAAGRTQHQGRGSRSPPGPPRPFAPRPEVSGFFCCRAAARQKRLPGPWAAGCPPGRLPARPAAREAAPCLGRGPFAGRQEGNGLNREASGEEVAPSCRGGDSQLPGPSCEPLARLLRAHLLRRAAARSRQACLPPRRCQGRWEGTRSPRPPAPTGIELPAQAAAALPCGRC